MQESDKEEYYSSLELPENPPESIELTPDNPPWGAWIAFGVWAFSIGLVVVIPNIFVIIYALIAGLPITEELTNDPTIQFIGLTAIVPSHILTLAAAVMVITQGGRFGLSETLGFEMAGLRWWHFLFLLLIIFGIAYVVIHFFPGQENEMMRLLTSSRAAVYLVAIIATFSAPVVEEVVYRGLLYSPFQRSMGKPVAIVIVTLIFSAIHVPQYWGSPGSIIMIVILSITLTLIRSMSKNLLPCIIFHALINGLQSILLIVEPYLKQIEAVEKSAVMTYFLR